jgi:leucyl/phenylalanyl-tRNA---protein transferase
VRPVPLTPRVLEFAYRNGYFPMSDPDSGETNWYRPDPRAILPIDGFHCSKSLAKTLRKSEFTFTFNQAFGEVMRACADRPEGTWISEEFLDAYGDLHRAGKAHSVEIRLKGELVGGAYGVALNGAFFAESMFHRETDASKVGLFHLVARLRECGYLLFEVQFLTPHLKSLGAIEISDDAYAAKLMEALSVEPKAILS